MSSETQDLNVKAERNRRNVLKMGAIFGSVALTEVEVRLAGKASHLLPFITAFSGAPGFSPPKANAKSKTWRLAIWCQRCSAASSPSSGSVTIQSREVIRRSLGRKTLILFGSLAVLSQPMFRKPIFT